MHKSRFRNLPCQSDLAPFFPHNLPLTQICIFISKSLRTKPKTHHLEEKRETTQDGRHDLRFRGKMEFPPSFTFIGRAHESHRSVGRPDPTGPIPRLCNGQEKGERKTNLKTKGRALPKGITSFWHTKCLKNLKTWLAQRKSEKVSKHALITMG